MDLAEEAIRRKHRSQTAGLGLFEAVPYKESGNTYTALIPTSHPDSVAGNSQARLILRHLQSGATLTALDALDLFGCNRLAARIADLRAKGYRVQSTLIELPNGKRVASYALLDK